MRVYTMDYASLEDAYGSAFGQRTPITHQSAKSEQGPLQASKSIDQRASESIEKHKGLIASVKKTIGYDTEAETETFTAPPPPPRQRVQEHFAASQPANIMTDCNTQTCISPFRSSRAKRRNMRPRHLFKPLGEKRCWAIPTWAKTNGWMPSVPTASNFLSQSMKRLKSSGSWV